MPRVTDRNKTMPLITIRKDTAENWAARNPVLEDGEQGLETDTRKLKLGDGETTWILLGYQPTAGDVSGVGDSVAALATATTAALALKISTNAKDAASGVAGLGADKSINVFIPNAYSKKVYIGQWQEAGDGSEGRPFQANTRAQYDAVMLALRNAYPVLEVHIRPGTYETLALGPTAISGDNIAPGSFWTILGAGVGQTIIKCPANTIAANSQNWTAFGTFAAAPNLTQRTEIGCLTIDSNLANQPAFAANETAPGSEPYPDIWVAAVTPFAARGYLHDIEVVKTYSGPEHGEIFPVSIYTTGGTKMTRRLEIERVRVLAAKGYTTAIACADQTGGTFSGHIRDCVVNGENITAFGAGQWDGFQLQNCSAKTSGGTMLTIDTYTYRDVLVAGCSFEGGIGIVCNGSGPYNGITVQGCHLTTDNAAIYDFGGVGVNGLNFIGNTLRGTGALTLTAGSGVISGNYFDGTTTKPDLTSLAGFTVRDNIHSDGTILPGTLDYHQSRARTDATAMAERIILGGGATNLFTASAYANTKALADCLYRNFGRENVDFWCPSSGHNAGSGATIYGPKSDLTGDTPTWHAQGVTFADTQHALGTSSILHGADSFTLFVCAKYPVINTASYNLLAVFGDRAGDFIAVGVLPDNNLHVANTSGFTGSGYSLIGKSGFFFLAVNVTATTFALSLNGAAFGSGGVTNGTGLTNSVSTHGVEVSSSTTNQGWADKIAGVGLKRGTITDAQSALIYAAFKDGPGAGLSLP